LVIGVSPLASGLFTIDPASSRVSVRAPAGATPRS
jgi:hypothetical protein